MTEFDEIRRLVDKIETNEEELKGKIEEKDDQIRTLESQVDELKGTISDLEDELFNHPTPEQT